MQILYNIYLQKFTETLTTLQTAFEDINKEQDKLIGEFIKKIDIHIKDMIQDVEQINNEANVITYTYYIDFDNILRHHSYFISRIRNSFRIFLKIFQMIYFKIFPLYFI